MRDLTRNIFMQLLMICALVTAGVSPACAFISGKMTMIEICGVDGLMQVAVPADQAPGHDADQHDRTYDCGFCIAHASGKALTTPDNAIIDFAFVYDDAVSAETASFVVPVLDGRLPVRGPPAVL